MDITPFFTAPTWASTSAAVDKGRSDAAHAECMARFEQTFGVPSANLRPTYGPDEMTLDYSSHYFDPASRVHYAYRYATRVWETEPAPPNPKRWTLCCCCPTT